MNVLDNSVYRMNSCSVDRVLTISVSVVVCRLCHYCMQRCFW